MRQNYQISIILLVCGFISQAVYAQDDKSVNMHNSVLVAPKYDSVRGFFRGYGQSGIKLSIWLYR